MCAVSGFFLYFNRPVKQRKIVICIFMLAILTAAQICAHQWAWKWTFSVVCSPPNKRKKKIFGAMDILLN